MTKNSIDLPINLVDPTETEKTDPPQMRDEEKPVSW